MAKELPYFKFEPSEWENGSIQMCSRESKGLFIELCSMYWARIGELPYALALQKLCNGDKLALQELQTNQIFTISDGRIVIEFLDEQLSEFQEITEKRRNAANKRWSDASALQMESKSNAKRREEKRREKSKVDKKSVFIAPSIEEMILYFVANGYSEESAKKAWNYYSVADWKDSKGNKVKNWKQKAQAVWFKEENKIGNGKSNNGSNGGQLAPKKVDYQGFGTFT